MLPCVRSSRKRKAPSITCAGRAQIDYRSYILQAEEITYNSETGDSELEGHVVLEGGPYNEHVEARHATYNVNSEVGKFYNVVGTVGFRLPRSRYVLTTTNPFSFTGKVVEKNGPNHYLVRQGTVTTCALDRPKWLFDAQQIVVEVDSTAKLYHADFRLMGVPVFYLPYATHAVQVGRNSGLLIPSIGKSSTKGYIAGEAFYWVFDRSADATVGAGSLFPPRLGAAGFYSECGPRRIHSCTLRILESWTGGSARRAKIRAARTRALKPNIRLACGEELPMSIT